MDLKRVYHKTQQGEESLKERALLPDTRLRAVLILVDGQHTGEQIARQLGKRFRPRSTLAELERLGLIEAAARQAGRTEASPAKPPAPVEAGAPDDAPPAEASAASGEAPEPAP
ncbi:MAG TPA: hypothetical protein VN279_16475, partial [Rhodocyclaceae bacterium]|nr:hypothetical protein [Rhodocyclaceae bacterium]